MRGGGKRENDSERYSKRVTRGPEIDREREGGGGGGG